MFVGWLRVLQKHVDRREPRVADGESVGTDADDQSLSTCLPDIQLLCRQGA